MPSTSLLRHGYQNDRNYFRIVLPRYTGIQAGKASLPVPSPIFTNKYCITALPSSLLPAVSQQDHLCSPTGIFLFLGQVHLFTLGPLLKQAKQLRAFGVKCLLPSYLTFCHSVLPGNEAAVIKKDYSKTLTKILNSVEASSDPCQIAVAPHSDSMNVCLRWGSSARAAFSAQTATTKKELAERSKKGFRSNPRECWAHPATAWTSLSEMLQMSVRKSLNPAITSGTWRWRCSDAKQQLKQSGIPSTATKSLLRSQSAEENMDHHPRLVILKGQVLKRRYEMGD